MMVGQKNECPESATSKLQVPDGVGGGGLYSSIQLILVMRRTTLNSWPSTLKRVETARCSGRTRLQLS